MTSVTELLPELLSLIFSFLKHDPGEIANCRLVCTLFYKLSSSFMVTRIIISSRLSDLDRSCRIAAHPILREQVTHMIFDASQYSTELARDWNKYVAACDGSQRCFRDSAYEDAMKEDDDIVRQVKSNTVPWSKSENIGIDADVDQEAHDKKQDRLHCKMGQLLDRMQEKLDFKGYSKGYLAYRRALRGQSCVAAVTPHMLSWALAAFPRLRNIRFGDFRALMRCGESYDNCCRRLFGEHTLEPMALSKSSQAVVENLLITMLQALADNTEARIESFSIGGYHLSRLFGTTDIECNLTRDPAALSLAQVRVIQSHVNISRVFQHLRRLDMCFRLGLEFHPWEERRRDVGALKGLLESIVPRLRELSLSVTDLIEQTNEGLLVAECSEDLFRTTLLPISCARLEILQLCGWVLDATAWKDFASSCPSTRIQLDGSIFITGAAVMDAAQTIKVAA